MSCDENVGPKSRLYIQRVDDEDSPQQTLNWREWTQSHKDLTYEEILHRYELPLSREDDWAPYILQPNSWSHNTITVDRHQTRTDFCGAQDYLELL